MKMVRLYQRGTDKEGTLWFTTEYKHSGMKYLVDGELFSEYDKSAYHRYASRCKMDLFGFPTEEELDI